MGNFFCSYTALRLLKAAAQTMPDRPLPRPRVVECPDHPHADAVERTMLVCAECGQLQGATLAGPRRCYARTAPRRPARLANVRRTGVFIPAGGEVAISNC